MSGRYKSGSGGVNTGKQRTYAGAYSRDCNDQTSRVLGDVPYYTGTRDKVRLGADHPDLGTYPGDKPNFYVSGDGFKMGKPLSANPDRQIDYTAGFDDYHGGPGGADGSNKGQWTRTKSDAALGGFAGAVEREWSGAGRGTQHPSQSDVSSWPSRGTDTPSKGQGSSAVPGSNKFSWR